jgi:hypothetical protein
LLLQKPVISNMVKRLIERYHTLTLTLNERITLKGLTGLMGYYFISKKDFHAYCKVYAKNPIHRIYPSKNALEIEQSKERTRLRRSKQVKERDTLTR